MKLVMSVKHSLNQGRVVDRMERAEGRLLRRFGAFVRRRARSSLRKRKRKANPGSPPSVHTGDKFRTLKNILFHVDPKSRTVIVGPVKLRSSKVKGSRPLPEILEFGKQGVAGEDDEIVQYEEYPFMLPALEAEIAAGTLLEEMKDSIP